MKAFIIEDEPLARGHMIRLLRQNFPQVEVVGEAGSVKEAVAWLSREPAPDVIFMDVELSDGSSFDIFTQMDVNAPVVMTTAYDQYAVHAFEVNAVDYLLKPIGLKELQRAIARVERGEVTAPANDTVRQIISQERKEKFIIRLNDRIVPVRTSDIAYFYSQSKNSYIVTLGGTSYVLDESLDTIAESLDPEAFFRISRNCIISEGVIGDISKLMGGRLRLTLKSREPAPVDLTVSRARTEAFLRWLGR